jgi:uncharacterized protein DUF4907
MYKRFIIPAIIIALGVLFYVFYFAQLKKEFASAQKHKGFVFVKVVPFQSSFGWGYEIDVDEKVYIKQPFIPAISGRRGFEKKEDALLVGNKVVSNINNQMSPAISIKDLEELGIKLKPSDTAEAKK